MSIEPTDFIFALQIDNIHNQYEKFISAVDKKCKVCEVLCPSNLVILENQENEYLNHLCRIDQLIELLFS